MLILAQISDTHVDNGPRAHERTRAVLAHLAALPGLARIDALLISGDIADNGLVAEYEEAASLFDLPLPIMTLPGNHDVRAAYRTVFLGVADPADPTESLDPAAPINQTAEVGDAVFLLGDSTIPGEHPGYLADETLAWMEAELERFAADRPVFICFHHPPVDLYVPFIDGIRQTGEDRLAALIERHPRIVAVLCGHAHTAAATTFAGRPLLVAPGVVSTVLLPWEEDSDLVDLAAPPGIAFHVLDDERRLTTHYRTVAV